ncbi:hypothetical protein KKF84_07405 [Myxococcota bacterium]|nr:hypothetical protein [Myxococcota bacterium]MBU1535130.1 hypothetical protein [Myxococcota bacterium]
MSKFLLVLLLLIALLVPQKSRGAKCPRGKVFSTKLLKCVAKKIYTCPKKQYRDRGRCVKFPYGTLSVKPLFADKVDFLKLPVNARRHVNKGLAFYKKQAYMPALYYFNTAFLIKPDEIVGHLIGESYRRTGSRFHAYNIYKKLVTYFPGGTHVAQAMKIQKRYHGLMELVEKCKKLQMPSCEALKTRYNEDIAEGYHSGNLGIAQVDIYTGKTKEARERLLKVCKMGLLRGCSGLGWLYHQQERNEILALRYFKIGCDGGGQWSCTLMGTFLEFSLMKPSLASTYYRAACSQLDPLGCIQLNRLVDAKKFSGKTALAYYERECIKNNSEACIKGGELAESLKKETRARTLYQRACHKKHTPSCLRLGKLLSKMPKGIYLALSPYRIACDEGDPEGCRFLGKTYATLQNYSIATECYKKYTGYFETPCKLGDQESCYKLLNFYRHDSNIPVKAKLWATHFLKIVEKQCSVVDKISCYKAMYTAASPLKDYKKSLVFAKKLCAMKESPGCERVIILTKRMGGTPSKTGVNNYRTLLQTQCESGNFNYCHTLGVQYASNKENTKAINYFKIACKGGFFTACMSLARLYEYNLKNYVLAEKWYGHACTRKYKYACLQLGLMYELKVKSNSGAAIWHQKACQLGLTRGCTRCATILTDIGETKKARVCYSKAATLLFAECRGNSSGSCREAGDIYGKILKKPALARKMYVLGAKAVRSRCQEGHMSQCYSYGLVLRDKLSDPKKALVYFQKACQRDFMHGCSQAANLLLRLNRKKEALALLQKACKKRHRRSCQQIARLTKKGRRKPRR